LTFGRIFGQSSWLVKSTSVAGIVQSRQYGLITLRPPRPRGNGTDANEPDMHITGGSKVRVDNADIGTNTNLVIDGINSAVILQNPPAPGPYSYFVWHYDPYQYWAAPPPGSQLTSPIADPNYPIPQRSAVPSTPVYSASGLTDAILGGVPGSALCQAEMAKVPTQYTVGGTPVKNMNPTKVTCYKPGIYTRELSNSKPGTAFLLKPGVYFFDKGLDIGQGTALIGGYEGNQPGVAIVLLSCQTANNCPFKGNAADLVALNFGSAFNNLGGKRATAAQWNGGLVQTNGIPPIMMTIMVEPVRSCLAPPFPIAEPSKSCTTGNNTIILPGNGNLWVAGVQYAPTDNSKVAGNNSGSQGVLGQIISWTIEFKGGASLNLEAAVGDTNGVLRLDPACSPTVSTCNP
jgi:hypothetical protein